MRNTPSFTVIVICVSSIKPRVSRHSLSPWGRTFPCYTAPGIDKNVTAVLAARTGRRRVAKFQGQFFHVQRDQRSRLFPCQLASLLFDKITREILPTAYDVSLVATLTRLIRWRFNCQKSFNFSSYKRCIIFYLISLWTRTWTNCKLWKYKRAIREI